MLTFARHSIRPACDSCKSPFTFHHPVDFLKVGRIVEISFLEFSLTDDIHVMYYNQLFVPTRSTDERQNFAPLMACSPTALHEMTQD